MKIVQWSAAIRRANPRVLLRYVALLLLWAASARAGSLYNPTEYQALIHDHRAKRVGDSLVVLVYETASATNQTNTKTNKSAAVAVNATDTYNPIGGKLGVSNDADGGGVEKRSGQVIARVSATVVDVLPSGEFVIRGKQHIELNNEAQFITVEGRVRPLDIDTNNTIISTRIADAKIEFVGQGLLSSREKPGVITRFFNWLF